MPPSLPKGTPKASLEWVRSPHPKPNMGTTQSRTGTYYLERIT
jgi:hypothetical protein